MMLFTKKGLVKTTMKANFDSKQTIFNEILNTCKF